MNGPGFEGQVRAVLAVAAALGRPWALVGGLAVSARAEPRFTRDVDLAVSVHDDRDAEDAVRTFLSRRYRTIWTLESRVEGRLAGVRLASPGSEATSEEGTVTDLLFASSGIEPEVSAAATRVEVTPGLEVPVASVGHLIALKLLAHDERRPQDLVDLQALRRVASVADLDLARGACALITSRGYHRGKDLEREFVRLTAPARPAGE